MPDIEERLSILETKMTYFEKTISELTDKMNTVVNDTNYIKGKLIMLCDKLSSNKNNIYMDIIKYLVFVVCALAGIKLIGV